jgi:cyclic pyranopterin phosphate synthase
MVDVGDKAVTAREAHARAVVVLPEEVLAALDGDEIQSKKGPVFATAIIAGVMAAKKTHELIPFCHPLGLDNCDVGIAMDGDRAVIDCRAMDGDRAVIDCRCKVTHKTGVEMEALTGASVAALTVYDMCKALSHDIVISETRLMMKTGGKQDFHRDG